MRALVRAVWMASLGCIAMSASAASTVSPGAAALGTGLDSAQFPEPAALQPAVRFWQNVFGTYSTTQSVLQSRAAPDRIIRVLNFNTDTPPSDRAAVENQAVADGEQALQQIVAAHANPAQLDSQARHLYEVLGGGDTAHFEALEGSLRVQRGLRERTRAGLEVAGRYLPRMRQIFAGYGLPTALTRLPIVESSFNVDAYSKVGAAGVWQFMPAAARIYMTLNAVQDDRRDPWTSTDAAARMLRDNYDALGSWPLAITAYNFGRGGLQRALDETGDTTLAQLIGNYQNPRFGFASKNFYAEFLAANVVVHNSRHFFGTLAPATPIDYGTVTTTDYVPYGTLRRISGADAAQFQTLNPAFSARVRSDQIYVPPGTTIRVPAGEQRHFQQLYASLGPGQRFDRQRAWYVSYRVRRGDVLGRIAQRHGVSAAQLMKVNHLRSARDLRIGAVLRIPSHGAAPHLVATAVRVRSHRVAVHRVRKGQTLSQIAERNHSTVHAIKRANRLRNADDLRIGMLLKIPRVN
ncbi:MAG TPA: LysM peptidoglycan-binding domain-containing protein [Nevskiaceae bacterium]|nr:LysM peptidoglycan-binding domain-containing protein [Nevskiaceae bacterium]